MQSKEVLLIIKTKKVLFKKVSAKVKSLHSYQTPEIIALPIVNGSEDYLGWISSCCRYKEHWYGYLRLIF